MSRPYTICGTGLCTNGLDYEISRNPNAKKAISKIIGKDEFEQVFDGSVSKVLFEYGKGLSGYNLGAEHLLVSGILNKYNVALTVVYERDCDNKFVLFPPVDVWRYKYLSKEEKNLTREKLAEIICEVATKLGANISTRDIQEYHIVCE